MGEHTGLPTKSISLARGNGSNTGERREIWTVRSNILDEAEKLYMSDFSPNVHPISALKARVWIKQGELEKALDWAHERKLSIEEEPSYLREFEQITFARILLSQYQSDYLTSVLHEAMGLPGASLESGRRRWQDGKHDRNPDLAGAR